jgi:hypothetical protein
MDSNDDICHKMASWSYHSNTTLPKLEMDCIVEQRGRGVPNQWR